MPGPDAFADDLALLVEAARAAGEIALRYWRKAPRTWDKGGNAGPVTEADLAVNDRLETFLRAARPDYGWLSEESPDRPDRLAARRAFIIDPLDGTRAFAAGDPTFAHSIAIAEHGRPVAGAVLLPVDGLLYTATTGGPALKNGAPIRAAEPAGAAGATLLTARRNLLPEHWRDGQVPPVRREFRGSLAYRLCLVAEGRFDAMLTLGPTWEWDIAAGSLIAARAGARVTDRHGAALAFNRPLPQADGVLAGGAALHAGLLGALVPGLAMP